MIPAGLQRDAAYQAVVRTIVGALSVVLLVLKDAGVPLPIWAAAVPVGVPVALAVLVVIGRGAGALHILLWHGRRPVPETGRTVAGHNTERG